jgi:molybdopterin-guanine dinucleotide biosynthesis protein A
MAGVILAGGRSRRMGGQTKALLPLAGKPLLRHVIDRVQPQVCCLALSVESAAERWQCFGLPLLPDPRPGFRGPLGGLLAALRFLQGRAPWLLLVPCDAPFLPLDLGQRLLECAAAAAAPGAVARFEGLPQPTFSLWHASLLPRLEKAFGEEGMAAFRQFLEVAPLAGLDWPGPSADDQPPPFFNVNDPQTLDQAGHWLQPAAGATECSA